MITGFRLTRQRWTTVVCSAAWLALGAALGGLPRPAHAATFTVDSTGDATDVAPGNGKCATVEGTCTLRAAVQETNALAGPDSVTLPAGTYVLSIPNVSGVDDDAAVTGDLDVLGDLTLVGAVTGFTTISGAQFDRVFDIFGTASLTIAHVIVESGSASGSGPVGGGIRNRGVLTMSSAVLRGNTARNGDGGAIANLTGGRAELTNVTVGANLADQRGGGIANDVSAQLKLVNVTLSGNSALQGGGISNLGTADLANTIIETSGQFTGSTCAGAAVRSGGHNLDSAGSCLLTEPSDLSNVDPKLGRFLNNGGATLTFALLPGSPAIDAGGGELCPSTDQRGFPRPADGNADAVFACDIGAYEADGPLPPTPTSTPPPTDTPTITPTQGPPTETPTETPTVPTPTETPSPTPTPTETPFPLLRLGTVTGIPGERVTFDATLTTDGALVGGFQNDIEFDAVRTPIDVLQGGGPACAINPAINKEPLFVFRPPDCTGIACNVVRAAGIPCFPPCQISPIADGSVLYRCSATIAVDAPIGEYPLVISRVQLSDPEGRVVGRVGTGGGIVVVLPTATPVPTATPIRCVGDCNNDGEVAVTDTIVMVNIALETLPASACPAGDPNENGEITVNEIIQAVNNALVGCSDLGQ
jgi:CSLREA domain-containing protein